MMDSPTAPIATAYTPAYFWQSPTPSMRKLPAVADAAAQAQYATLHAPEPVRREDLLTIHDEAYVDAIFTGKGELALCAFGEWTERYRDGVLAICGGNLLATEFALRDGLAANVGQGFHHARPHAGAGYCTFNGLALVAAMRPDLRVLVIDCDEHAGDGTGEFAGKLPNLHNFSICGVPLGCTDDVRSFVRTVPARDVAAYRAHLTEAVALAGTLRPDLVIYQAGMDPHENDPLARSRMTTDFLRERDEFVLRALTLDLKIPTFFVLAGGYQEPFAEKLLPLHLATFEIAAGIRAKMGTGPSSPAPLPRRSTCRKQ